MCWYPGSSIVLYPGSYFWPLPLQELHCVVLVEEELSSALQVHLSHPVWARRITVIIGSPLRVADLIRARLDMVWGPSVF